MELAPLGKRARTKTTKGEYVATHPESVGKTSHPTQAFAPSTQTIPIDVDAEPEPSLVPSPATPASSVGVATSDNSTFSSPLPATPSPAPTMPRLAVHTHSQQPPSGSTPTNPEATSRPDYRLTLEGRANVNCAAESPYFKRKLALCYAFLEVTDVVLDDLGKMESCLLRCPRCQMASWKFTKKAGGSTSNFNEHLSLRHPGIWKKAKAAEAAALGLALPSMPQRDLATMLVASKTFDLDTFWEKVGRWFILSNQPFTEIESPELRDLIYYLKPALEGKLVGRKQLRERFVGEMYDAHRSRFKDCLLSVPGAIPLAFDAWTSSNAIAFLSIVGSYITDQWTLETGLIDFVELHGSHTGENMAKAVFSAVEELGIVSKMISQTTDSASNNDTAFHHFSSLLAATGITTRWNACESQLRCLDHVLHLSVMDLLDGIKGIPEGTAISSVANLEISSLSSDKAELVEPEPAFVVDVNQAVDLASAISKIRKISKIVCSSPQRLKMWRLTVRRMEDDKSTLDPSYQKCSAKTLIIDVPTRWNSTCLMIERALEFRDAIDDLCDNQRVKLYVPYKLDASDWELVILILGWLKIFRTASNRMAGDTYPTLSHSLITYVSILRALGRMKALPQARASPSVMQGLRASEAKILKFFDKSTLESELYYFAIVLDPRFKVSLFRNNQDLFDDEWISGCHSSMLDTLASDYEVEGAPTHAADTGSIPSDFDAIMNSVLGVVSSTTSPAGSAQELRDYLGEPVVKGDPLLWWKGNASRFPSLAKMARDVLAIPGSSVSVERTLNIGRDVISLRRASLSAETIRALMNLRSMLLMEKRAEPQIGQKRRM